MHTILFKYYFWPVTVLPTRFFMIGIFKINQYFITGDDSTQKRLLCNAFEHHFASDISLPFSQFMQHFSNQPHGFQVRKWLTELYLIALPSFLGFSRRHLIMFVICRHQTCWFFVSHIKIIFLKSR